MLCFANVPSKLSNYTLGLEIFAKRPQRNYKSVSVFNTRLLNGELLHVSLSYDVAVIQWLTSCHKKSYAHTRNNSLARIRNVIDNVRVNNAFSH